MTECKGLFFKAVGNEFVNTKGEYVITRRMRPLRRISCKGCKECHYLNDQFISFGDDIHPLIEDDFVPGAVYQLQIENITKDFETGYPDYWDLVFRKVE